MRDPSNLKTPSSALKRNVYPGWWMVIVTAIVSGLGVGFVGQGISVFFKPLAADLNLSRAATSLATGIARLQGGIEGPLTGWLSDKYGPKWVIVSGVCFMVGGLVLMNFATSPWQYYVFWGIMIGIGQNLGLTIATDKALSDWFVAKRGLAFGVRFGVIGICQIAVVPLVTWLMLLEGWRTTCFIWAGIMALGIPLIIFFVRPRRPEYYGLLPDGYEGKARDDDIHGADIVAAGREYAEGFEEHEFTIRQALKTQAFWLMLFAWSCSIIVIGGFSVHVIPFLTDMGISETTAGGMLSMMIFFMIPSRFFAGFLADRLPKEKMRYLAALSVFIQAMGLVVFIAAPGLVTAYVLLILYGFGNGAVTPLRLSMGGRFFGRKAFASILGVGMFINAPLGFVSPIFSGWIYDITGNYTAAFVTYAALLFIATALFFFLRTPARPRAELQAS